MLRPLPIDLFDFVWPAGLGVLLFLVGVRMARWPLAFRATAFVLAIATVLAGAALLVGVLPPQWDPGGLKSILSWAALLMLGYAWREPNRRFSTGFLAFLVAVPFFLLQVEASGRLWWRYIDSASWERFPDSNSCLQQSSVTCGAVSAAMLLHQHGIEASEGEMAYLSGTSWFGADARGLRAALEAKSIGQDLGWEIAYPAFGDCVSDERPFIAFVRMPKIGGHAVLVERASDENVDIIDPLDGMRKTMSREAFLSAWEGTVIRASSAAQLNRSPN